MAMAYPLFCMKMSDFLKLESLEPHNSLVERGLVVPVDLDGAHKVSGATSRFFRAVSFITARIGMLLHYIGHCHSLRHPSRECGGGRQG